MKQRNLVMTAILGFGLLAGGAIMAQERPVENIDPARHPNLADAQHMIGMAYEKISMAQRFNDMEGHGVRAKELLAEASRELKEAAEAANRHEHRDEHRDDRR